MIQPLVGAGLKTHLRRTAGLLSQSIPICGDHILLSMDRSVPVSTTTSIALCGGWDSVGAFKYSSIILSGPRPSSSRVRSRPNVLTPGRLGKL